MKVREKNQAAFTLMELLVSMTILILILVMTVRILGDVSTIWSSGNQRSEIYQTGRAVIEMMGREISLAEPLPAQSQGNFKSFASSPLVINPPLAAGLVPRKDSANVPMDSVFFYSPLRSTAKGPLVCVGYFTKSDFTLQRLAILATNTKYPAMAAANLPVYDMWNPASRNTKSTQFSTPVSWLNPTSGKTVADAAMDPSVTAPIAERVLGFFIRPIGRDGEPLPSTILPSTAPSFTAGSSATRAYNSAWTPVVDSLPTQIEITLIIAEANAFERLKSQNAVPVLTMPSDNSDEQLELQLTDLKARLVGKINQYLIITRRFPLSRGSR